MDSHRPVLCTSGIWLYRLNRPHHSMRPAGNTRHTGSTRASIAAIPGSQSRKGRPTTARVYVAPGNSDVVYVTNYSDAGGIYRSRNAGADWTLLNQGLVISGLAIDPDDGERLLATTAQGLLLSVNGGDSWSPVTDLAGIEISSVAFHPRLAGVAFAAARNRLYRSDNGGSNWSLLNEGAGVLESINRIRFDPLSNDILYVATVYCVYKVSATEVGGRPVRFAPPYGFITGLELSGGERTTLHVALDGRGVYSLTPVSDQRYDFGIVEIGPREFTPGLGNFNTPGDQPWPGRLCRRGEGTERVSRPCDVGRVPRSHEPMDGGRGGLRQLA